MMVEKTDTAAHIVVKDGQEGQDGGRGQGVTIKDRNVEGRRELNI